MGAAEAADEWAQANDADAADDASGCACDMCVSDVLREGETTGAGMDGTEEASEGRTCADGGSEVGRAGGDEEAAVESAAGVASDV